MEVTDRLAIHAKAQEKTGNGDLAVFVKGVTRYMKTRVISILSNMKY